MAASLPLCEVTSSAGNAERSDIDAQRDNTSNAGEPAANSIESRNNDSSSPTVSIEHLEGVPVQNGFVSRPWWLCGTGILDIAVVGFNSAWSFHTQRAVKTRPLRGGTNEHDKLAPIWAVIYMSYFIQFLKGLLMTIALCHPGDTPLKNYLRTYLIGCCIILMATIVVVGSTALTMFTGTYDYEQMQIIVGNGTNLIFTLVVITLIRKLLRKYNGAVSPAVIYEHQSRNQNFGRRLHRHQVPQNSVHFAVENQVEAEPGEIFV